MKESLTVFDSLLVTVIGMAIVFMGLVILIFLIKALVKLTEGKKKQASPAPAAIPAAVPSREAEPVYEDVTDDTALVAAITAALCVVMEGETSGFTVRRVRRVANASPWQRAGREEQIYSRQ